MFAEYLERYPLDTLPVLSSRSLYPPEGDRAWNCVSAEHRNEIIKEAAVWLSRPYPLRPVSGFLAFVRDGSRKADEDPYFTRRRKLCWHLLAACLDRDAPTDPILDGIWCICEETSWVISAHNVNPIPGAPAPRDYPLPDPDRPYIDLFSAQTGMILALSASLTGDRLDDVSPMIRGRIRRELDRRIFHPFMEHDDFWWMGVKRKDLCNWTPWIISNIMVCACSVSMDRGDLAALLDRACRILDRWLAVMPEDGGCDEGAGYWNMAGGSLLDCLEILEKVTDGRMTFWQEPKIRNILSFPLKAEIGDGWFVNFADCDARPYLSGERLQLAGERMNDPDLTALGLRFRGSLADQLNDVPHLTRLLSLLFHPAVPASEPPEKTDTWLPDLQLRVVRRGHMVLCGKGGHNAENHNHNDVGSFMLYMDGQPAVVDAGNMVYTARTFSSERYTLWNVRSAYHNVPMIGNAEQCAGREYAARNVSCLPDGLELNMAGAYPAEAGIRSFLRRMTLTPEGAAITDTLSLDRPQPVVWVFIFRNPPSAEGKSLRAAGLRLDIPDGFTCKTEQITVSDPRMARNFPGSLWRVLLAAPERERISVTWNFRKE